MPRINQETIATLYQRATDYQNLGAQLRKEVTNFERDPSLARAKLLADFIEQMGDESIPCGGFLMEEDADQGTPKADE
jgi:hypothetical protein